MKKITFLISALFLSMNVFYAQSITNGGFETWQVNSYYDYPDNWFIIEEDGYANQLAEKSNDFQHGSFSLKLNTIDVNGNNIFAAAVYGIPGDNGFKGLPYNQLGDLLHFSYKSNIQPGDMGMMWLMLYKNGVTLDSIVVPFMSSVGTWTQGVIPVNQSQQVPDSMFLGFLSSVPQGFGGNPVAGTWLMIDNVYFTLGMNPTPIPVPNFSFENWLTATGEDPSAWTTDNSNFFLVTNDTATVTKTTDAHSGNLAARIATIEIAGEVFKADLDYNHSISFIPEGISFHYKYAPSGVDTVRLMVDFLNNGQQVGGYYYEFTQSQATYTQIAENLSFMGTPDSVVIQIRGGENTGTVLILDDLSFTCSKPGNLHGYFTSTTTATLTWSAGTIEDAWEVEWGVSGFVQGTGTLQSVTATSQLLLTSITDAQNYDFYVKAVCGPGDESSWAGPFTMCKETSVPVIEGFEQVTNGGIPTCWHKIDQNPSRVQANNMMPAHNGTKYLEMNIQQNLPAYIVSPALSNNIGLLMISFYAMKSPWVNDAMLQIGTMSNPSDENSFDVLQTYVLTSGYLKYSYYFNAYVGTDKHIALRLITNDWGAEALVDDIEINLLPSCIPPANINIGSITTNAASVTWQPGGTEVLWDIVYGETGFDPMMQGNSDYSITPPYNLSSLNSGTSYDVYLRSDCDNNDLSDWTLISFTTLCTPSAVPLVQNFEGNLLGQLPNCWSSAVSGWGEASVVNWNGNFSPKSVNMRVGNLSDSIYLVTPQLIPALSTLNIDFDATKNPGNPILTLGTMTNPNNAATFTPLQTISLQQNYQHFSYSFSSYQGTDNYIAFQLKTSDNMFTEVFLDNIVIALPPTCLQPQQVAMQSATQNSITVTWQAGGTELLWNLKYGNPGFNPNMQGTPVNGLTQPSHTATMLSPASHYDFYIQADCGSGDLSAWTGPFTFSTDCGVLSTPFTESFESQNFPPNCWTLIAGSSNWKKYMGAGGYGNSNSAATAEFFNIPNSTPFDLLTYAFDATNLLAPQLSFDYAYAGYAQSVFDNLKVYYSTDNGQSFNLLINMPGDGLLNTAGYYQSFFIPNQSQWMTQVINLPQGANMIKFTAQSGSGNNLYIDNVGVNETPLCNQPNTLSVSSITTTSAQLSWMPGSNETMWNVEIGLQGFIPGTGAQVNMVQGHTAISWQVSGLSVFTSYDFYVQADCGNSNLSNWTGPFTFATLCGAFSTPFTETFEAPSFPPSCWQLVQGAGSWQLSSSAGGYGNSNASALAEFYNIQVGTPFDMISFEFDASSLTAPYLSFDYAYARYNAQYIDTLQILVSSDNGANYSLLTQMDGSGTLKTAEDFAGFFIPSSSQWITEELALPAGTNRVLFRGLSAWGNNLYVDNVSVAEAPLCPKPHNLYTLNETHNSVDLGWTPGANETMWNIEVGIPGLFTPGTSTYTTQILATPNNPVTVTGLAPSTTYIAYVQAYCGGMSASTLSAPFTFTTTCETVTVPYVQNFESTTPPGIPFCNSIVNAGTGNNWRTTFAPGFGFNNNTLLYSANYTNPANAWYFTQGVELNGGTTYSISFRYGNNTSSWTEKLKVAYGSTPQPVDMVNQLFDFPSINLAMAQNAHQYFTPTTTGVYYFGFNAYSDINQYYLFVDDIQVNVAPACLMPVNLNAASITDNSALLQWDNPSNAPLFHVAYGLTGFTLGTGTEAFVSSLSHTASALIPASSYDFYVRSVCGAGDTSTWSGPYFFTTACEVVTSYFENFDLQTNFALPFCWAKLTATGNAYTYSQNAFSLPNSLDLNSSAPNDLLVLAMQKISNISLNTHWLKFMAKSEPGGTLDVGYLTDPDDAASYVHLQTIQFNGTVYKQYKLAPGALPVGVTALAFRKLAPPANMVSVDDVSWEQMPACPGPDMFSVTVNGTTETTATIQWTELGTATQWEIEYGIVGPNPPQTIAVNTNPATLTGLEQGTSYYFKIRSVCTPDVSDWAEMYTFTTACGINILPYYEDFSSTTQGAIPTCWQRSANNWYVNNSQNAGGNVPEMIFSWDPQILGTQRVISPAISAVNAPSLMVSFRHALTHYPQGNPYSIGLELTYDDVNWFSLWSMSPTHSIPSEEIFLDLSAYTGDTLKLAWVFYGDSWDTDTWHVDNILVDLMPSCPKPQQLTASPVSPSSVQTSWTEIGSADEWQIEWGLQSFGIGNGIRFLVTQPQHLFFGLDYGVTYEYYVRSVCAPGDTSLWSGPFAFRPDMACPAGSVYGQVPSPVEYILWSAPEMDRKVHQSFSAINQPFDGLHFWGRLIDNNTTPCYTTPLDLQLTFYNDDNGNIGTAVHSFTVPVVPDSAFNNNGNQFYEFFIEFPQIVSMSEGWFSVQSVNSPTCYLLIANTTNPNAQGIVKRVQNQGNDTLQFNPIGYCLTYDSYIVNYMAGQGGVISGQQTQYIMHGGISTLVFAQPDPCYYFVEWSDGRSDNPRNDEPVVSNINVTALFALIDYDVHITEHICAGDTFILGNQVLTASGSFNELFQTTEGCDSTVYLTLIVHDNYLFTENQEMCSGDTLVWRNDIYTAQGIYYDSLQTIFGCDSVFVLQLTVHPGYEFTETIEVCAGDTITWRNMLYHVHGVYFDSLLTVNGCDSVYVLDFVVHPNYLFVEYDTACDGQMYNWRGLNVLGEGTFHDSLLTIYGCDSVYLLHLAVMPIYEFSDYASICDGDTFVWRGNNYTTHGYHYDFQYTSQGCDSTFVLYINVNPTYNYPETVEICDGETYTWRGQTYDTTGTYFNNFQTEEGCDSVYVLNLIVHPTFVFVTNDTICNGETYIWRTNSFTQQGVYYDSLTTQYGCDSVYVLHLIVNPVFEFIVNDEICNGATYTWRGNSYTAQGTYYDSLLTVNGCDSVFVLNLTVHPTFLYPQQGEICDGAIFNWRGNNYTLPGMYYDSLLTVNGCDSVYALNLTVRPLFENTLFDTICYGDTLLWRGNHYTNAGLYYDSLMSQYGCDSVYVLDLHVNPRYGYLDSATICQGDTFIWRGNNYTTAGYHLDSYLAITGCDSVYVLHLTVNPTYTNTLYDTICDGSIYTWRGNTYTSAGTYYDSLQTHLGCDSIFVLQLHVYQVNVSVTQAAHVLQANATGATYQWVNCDNNFAIIQGATAQTYTATANGNYAVIVTQNSCTDTSSCYAVTGLYTDEYGNTLSINLYPNPSDGNFNLSLNKPTHITLWDALAQKLYENQLPAGIHNLHFSHLPNGVYYIRAQSDNLIEVLRVVVQR